jgi:hypothetical protein
MKYSELDKRLLKRAVQVQVRRIPVKQSNWAYHMHQEGRSNYDLGESIAIHVQNLAAYTPGTPEFNRYVEENSLNPNAAAALHKLGERLIDLAGSPDTFAITGGKFDAEAVQKLLESPQGQQIKNEVMQGFEVPSLLSAHKNLENAGILKNVYEVGKNTPAGEEAFAAQQANQENMSLIDPRKYLSSGIGTAMDMYNNPELGAKIRDQAGAQVMQGFGRGINTNSPLARRLIAAGATGYLKNKINEWAPRTSAMGRGFNSIGNFLLGLVSMMPGYESITNWLANRDFMFGKELRALPGQIQNAGAARLQGQPAVPPAQPPAQPPTKPPAVPPAQPPVVPPAQPPAQPPTKPPAVPPAQPPVVPPQPPAQPPTKPPAVPPAQPPVVPPPPRYRGTHNDQNKGSQ